MLVLPHTDGLGFDLHHFRQWVLQPAGDGDRPANGHVQVRQFAGGEFRGGIDRSTGFADHNPRQLQLRVTLAQVRDQLFGFAGGRTVTNGHQFNAVLPTPARQLFNGLIPLVAGRVRENTTVPHHLAGAVDDGNLHTGAQAGVQPQCGAGARRRQ